MTDLQKEQKEKFDCADAALTGTIRTAEEMNLPLQFKFWSLELNKWDYLDQADYKNAGEFESAVRTKLGAIINWMLDDGVCFLWEKNEQKRVFETSSTNSEKSGLVR